MKIEVLVIGCAKCKRLERNVEQALKELDLDVEIVRITDIEEIRKRGTMRVPVLFIDGEIVSAGGVPSVEEIKSMLSKGESNSDV